MTTTRYTIERRDACVLVYGAIPAEDFSTIAKLVSKKSVVSPDVAHMAGANFAFGLPDDLDHLRAVLRDDAEAREASKPANSGLSPGAIKWLASGERGVSSDTLFSVLTGVDAMNGFAKCHPWDPADFRRCALLLDQCPDLRENLDMMRAVSPTWNALVDRWNEISLSMAAELGDWRNPNGNKSAKKTYALIQSIIFPFETEKP